MKTKRTHRILAWFTVLMLAFVSFGPLGLTTARAEGSVNVAGIYEGTSTAANGTVYTHKLTLNLDGSYRVEVSFSMAENTYTEAETGTYTATETGIAFTCGKYVCEMMDFDGKASDSTGTIQGTTLTISRYASYMAYTMGKDPVQIVFTQTQSFAPADTADDPADSGSDPADSGSDPANSGNDPSDSDSAPENPEAKQDVLKSGTYQISVALNMGGSAMTMAGDIKIDRSTGAFEVWRNTSSGYVCRSAGKVNFDTATGVYTVQYTNPAEKTSTFTCAKDSSSITFTSPLFFGSVALNTTENGIFIPYTATREVTTVPDDLPSGRYDLVYAEGTYEGHQHQAIFRVNAEADTWETMDEKGYAKGKGTLSFDAETGVYTITYTGDVAQGNIGKTATFRYTDGVILFESPIFYGQAMLNMTDNEGMFVPYTAVLNEDPYPTVTEEEKEPLADTTGKKTGSAKVQNIDTGMGWQDYGITVAVTLDENGKITNIEPVSFQDKDPNKSLSYYTRFARKAIGTQEAPGLLAQLFGKTAEEVRGMKETDVDAVSSATRTTFGAFAAVQDALKTTGSAKDVSGEYVGTYESVAMGRTTTYHYALSLTPDGTYELGIEYTMGETTYHEKENGTYEVSGDTVSFAGGAWQVEAMEETFVAPDSTGTATDDGLDVKRFSSYMSKSMSGIPVTIHFTKSGENTGGDDSGDGGDNGGTENTDSDIIPGKVTTGVYELKDEDYDSSAAMTMPAEIAVDMEKGTFKITKLGQSEDKGSGTIAEDPKKPGEYILTYSAGVRDENIGKTVRVAATEDGKGMTFLEPMLFGSASMNTTDADGVFIPYTAHKRTSGGEDPAPKTPEYQFVEGGNGTVVEGASVDFRMRIRDTNGNGGEFDKFVSIEIDGTVLDAANYDKSEGSVVLVLKGSYVKTLTAGAHTVKVNLTDGSAETKLTVRSASNASRAKTQTRTNVGAGSPKTGDEQSVIAWLIMLAVAGIILLVLKRRQLS